MSRIMISNFKKLVSALLSASILLANVVHAFVPSIEAENGHISHTQIIQRAFQTRINEFASIVSSGELILEAKKLHTKSAKIGNAYGDKSKEHFNVGQRIDETVAEVSYARDNSFQLDGSDLVTVGKAAGDFLDKVKACIPEKGRREALAQISSEEETVAKTSGEVSNMTPII